LGDGKAIPLGEARIQQDDAERSLLLFCLAQCEQRLSTASAENGLRVPSPEQTSQNSQAGGVIVHHQHLLALKVGWRSFFPGWRGRMKAGGEVKGASLADFALQPDLAAHHFDQSR